MLGWTALIFLVLTFVAIVWGVRDALWGSTPDVRQGSIVLYGGAFIFFVIFVVLGTIWLAMNL